MKKHILIIGFSLVLVMMLSPMVSAADPLKVEVSGRNGGNAPAPVTIDGTGMFPIGRILTILDISGTETILTDKTPISSFLTFRGIGYVMTEGENEVIEYTVDESGLLSLSEKTGNVYHLNQPAVYPQQSKGVYVPLNFIADIVVGSDNDTIYWPDESILVFNMYTWDTEQSEPQPSEQIEAPATPSITPVTLAMKINSPWLLTEDDGMLFDEANHTITPIVRNGITLLPISPIINQLGGQINWSAAAKKMSIMLNQDKIEMWLNNKIAIVNGERTEMNIAPVTLNGRTLLPVRFIAQNLGAKITWDKQSQIIMVYYGGAQVKETDFFTYDYKITLLDAQQKQEDKRQSLDQAIKRIQEEHNKIKYNDTDPLDYGGKTIQVGDTVGLGTFSGIVKEVRGARILVYWNYASFLVDTGKERETAQLFGINWLADQWMEAKVVTLE